MKAWVCLMLVLGGCMSNAANERRLIQWGWDTPRLQHIPDVLTQAQALPFDGMVVDVETPLDTRGLSWTLFGAKPVDTDTLDQLAEDYGTLQWGRLTDRFLRLTIHPADVDWFDDWQVIYDNAEAWARLAHGLGFVGILLDVEQYNEAHLFAYALQAHADTVSFDEYAHQAVERGRAFMDALETGYPGLTVMFTYGLTAADSQTNVDWQEYKYGLLIPFVEGMLMTADSTTMLVDGYENSYIYKDERLFWRARAHIKSASPLFVPQYAADWGMQVGFGLWLDPVCGEGGLPVEGCGFSPQEFERTLNLALEYTDRYIWIYSQKINWYTGEGIPPVWQETFAKFR